MGAIDVIGLEREFKGGIRAVDGIDLEVAPGEVFGFLGPNGAGKTTTVRMLVTLLRPTGGRAEVAGFDVAREPAEVRRRIGVALQEAALDLLMTGRELMELQAVLHGIPPRQVRERAADLVRRVGLDDAAERRVGTYSGGMRRRLDLAMALIHEPAGPVPRRADHRPGPDVAADAVGRGAAPARRGHDRLPDHAVPRGGRPARRPRRHHRRRSHRRRGQPRGAQGRDRPAPPRRDAGRGARRRPRTRGARALRRPPAGRRRLPRVDRSSTAASGEIAPVVRALDDAGLFVASLEVVRPTLDDVFLAKTGEHLEGAAADAAPADEPEPKPEQAPA